MKKFLISFFIFLFLFQTKNFSSDCGVKQLLEQSLAKQPPIALALSIVEPLQEVPVDDLLSISEYLEDNVSALDEAYEDFVGLLSFFESILPEPFSITAILEEKDTLFGWELVYSLDMLNEDENFSIFKAPVFKTTSRAIRMLRTLRRTEQSQFSSIDTLAESLSKVDVIFSLIDTSSRLAIELGISLDECEAEIDDFHTCIDLWNSVLDIFCPAVDIICPFP
ncbi:hypothetical protein ACFLYA_01650 [Candidatus Dependentiae bacterium]